MLDIDERLQRALEYRPTRYLEPARADHQARSGAPGAQGHRRGPPRRRSSWCEQGYLDDARFARMFVADKRELEQWGRERIRRGLLARGSSAIWSRRARAGRASAPGRPSSSVRSRCCGAASPARRATGANATARWGSCCARASTSELALDALAAVRPARLSAVRRATRTGRIADASPRIVAPTTSRYYDGGSERTAHAAAKHQQISRYQITEFFVDGNLRSAL